MTPPRGLSDLVDDLPYTAADAARLLAVDVETVYRMAADGRLPSAGRVGGRHRFLGAAIKRFFVADQLAALPGPAETAAERAARARAAGERAAAEVRRRKLAGVRP